jgi:hypothetical protein
MTDIGMTDINDPKDEGHTREWQDRARVVLDAKKDANTEASPKQSPESERTNETDRKKEESAGEEKGDNPVY